MITRWATGLVFGAMALGTAWIGSYGWFVFILCLLWLASTEWRQLGQLDDPSVDVSIVLGGLVFIWVGVTHQIQYLSFLPVLLLFPAVTLFSRQAPERSRNLVWTAAGMLWLSLPAALVFLVRHQFGLTLLLVVLAGTVVQDTFALYSGMLFGSDRSFSPGLSPNKTWAGFWGSVTGSLIVYFTVGILYGWPVNLWLSLGLLLGVIGQVGDLSISGLKRRIDLDDTGYLFPGHGGILDRVDGLIFNVAIFYPFCYLLEPYL